MTLKSKVVSSSVKERKKSLVNKMNKLFITKVVEPQIQEEEDDQYENECYEEKPRSLSFVSEQTSSQVKTEQPELSPVHMSPIKKLMLQRVEEMKEKNEEETLQE